MKDKTFLIWIAISIVLMILFMTFVIYDPVVDDYKNGIVIGRKYEPGHFQGKMYISEKYKLETLVTEDDGTHIIIYIEVRKQIFDSFVEGDSLIKIK